ncbi:MAG: hypothetical protein EOO40_11855, partial [Deltaproteobacteria bacterium]
MSQRALLALLLSQLAACSVTGGASYPTDDHTAAGNESGGSDSSGAPDDLGGSPASDVTGSIPPSGNLPGTTLSSVDFEDGSLGGWTLAGFNGAPAPTSAVQAAPFGRSGKALKVVAGGGYTDAVFLQNTALFPLTPGQFYVRFHMALETALSQQHTTFAVVDDPNARNSEVRLGGQFGYLVANLEQNDAQRRSGGNAGDPSTAPGLGLTPQTWYCLEMHYDTANQAMQVWLDDTQVDALTIAA